MTDDRTGSEIKKKNELLLRNSYLQMCTSGVRVRIGQNYRNSRTIQENLYSSTKIPKLPDTHPTFLNSIYFPTNLITCL